MKNRLLPGLRTAGLLLFILVMAVSGFAQGLPVFDGKDPKVPQAEFSVVASKTKDICVGDVITLTFKGKSMMEGWHLYSSRTDGNIQYNPTTFKLFADESKGVKLKGKMTENHVPDEVDDEIMGGLLRSFHEKEVDFKQKIEITGANVVVSGQFDAQVCKDDAGCFFLKPQLKWAFTAKDCGLGVAPVVGDTSGQASTPPELNPAESFSFTAYDSTVSLSQNVLRQDLRLAELFPKIDSAAVCAFYHPAQAKAYSAKVGRPLLMYFTAYSDAESRRMEAEIFKNPAVDSILRHRVVLAKFFVDEKAAAPADLKLADGSAAQTLGAYFADFQLARFGVVNHPLFTLSDSEGRKFGESIGYTDAESFAKWLKGSITEYYTAAGKAEAPWGPAVTAAPTTAEQETTSEASGDCSPSALWSSFIIAFFAGLIAILTPCVFPMIPMTVSFFVKQGEGAENRAKGIRNGLLYAASIIFIYGFVGFLISVIFGGKALYILGSHPIPNLIFFAIFFVFALSFLGMFEITLPSKWSTAANNKATAGGILGPFFMALTLVIVSFSCTGPILGAALVQTTQGTECGWKPFAAMLGFGFAFGIPFGLMAMLPKLMEKLPMAGGWMNTVKVVFGFLELALCMKFLSNFDQVMQWHLLDRQIFLGLWIVIFICLAFYFFGWILLPHDEKKESITVPRLLVAIGVLGFVMYLVPGMWGGPLPMMEGLLPPMNKEIGVKLLPHQFAEEGTINSKICKSDRVNAHIGVENEAHGFCMFYDLDQAIAFAKEQNKPLFVDFTGHTCANCRKMEQQVWPDDNVRKLLLNEFVMVSLYADDKTEFETPKLSPDGVKLRTVGDWVLDYSSRNFSVMAQPLYVLMNHDETKLVLPRGFNQDIPAYVEFLKSGIAAFNKKHGITPTP